jgi:hypothetical protein
VKLIVLLNHVRTTLNILLRKAIWKILFFSAFFTCKTPWVFERQKEKELQKSEDLTPNGWHRFFVLPY